jgi:serine/threonine protein kinase
MDPLSDSAPIFPTLAVGQTHASPGAATAPAATEPLTLAGRAFLDNLVRLQLLTPGSVNEFLKDYPRGLADFHDGEALGNALVQARVLTQFQLDRILAGNTHGLVLGNYRVLDRLGAGAMGVVFLGEHVMMRRRVAIKVMPVDDDCRPERLERFYSEMRALAELNHPNIVMAYDSGRGTAVPGQPMLLYLVMELVDGCNLEQYVFRDGVLPIGKACNWMRQAACGLQEAHNHRLVHRDVKPSNILLTRSEQIKLVDFGLVRHFAVRLTDPRCMLGTLDFMPPEQSIDPTSVGTHADIYALGATLFWLLTGEPPYPVATSVTAALEQLQYKPARRLRDLRPDAPVELDAVLARLLDRDPMRRPPVALSVMKYLEPFAAG